MVIGDRPLDELVPVYRDPRSNMPVTQFNWKYVEAAGLVKFDFLGLKTLTVLQKALELIERGHRIKIDLATLPVTDTKAYELLAKADTAGVFQLESTGMRESLKRLKPDRLEDIIAMVALYRPGPMDNIPTYINRKHGDEPVDYLHPMLEGILKETYGVIIYQEQVIQIAQVMGGYSLGQADLLRRAMGKKDKAEMARQQARFVEGAKEKGVKEKDSSYIFELVDKFAGYGFNKSHAAAYALVSYHTAYLKANFREEFLAASMTLDMANTDKLAMFVGEARKAGIAVLPPCVNGSDVEFTVEFDKPRASPVQQAGSEFPSNADGPRGAIRYALAGLKNIGRGAVETIVESRKTKGPYASLADFASRLNPKALNKRGLETLAAGGAFDAFDRNRALVHANVEQILREAGSRADDEQFGQGSLLGGMQNTATSVVLNFRTAKSWTPIERLQHEFGAVGFYLSGHPLDAYGRVLAKLGVKRFTEFENTIGLAAGRLAGIVISARERRSAKGNKFAFAMFSDASGQFEAVIFSDTLARCREILVAGTAVLMSVEAERDGDTVKLRVQNLEPLESAAANVQQSLKIVLDRRTVQASKGTAMAELRALLDKAPANGKGGEIRLAMEVENIAGGRGALREVEFKLPGRYDIGPRQQGELLTVPGVLDVLEV